MKEYKCAVCDVALTSGPRMAVSDDKGNVTGFVGLCCKTAALEAVEKFGDIRHRLTRRQWNKLQGQISGVASI